MKLTYPRFKVATLICLASLVGCNSRQSTQQPPVESEVLAVLNPQQEAQKLRAIDAKEKLFQSLLGELTTSMGTNGPAKSITVCKTRAPEIAEAVSKETGVRIGRTSFQLRNQANLPPAWAASHVAACIEKPIEVALPGGELGVLLPIRLQATCTICHGSEDQVMPDVKAAIVSNYPSDSATGFAEGDLRGYFWVEVPATGRVE